MPVKIDGELRRAIHFRRIFIQSCSTCISGFYEGGLFYCYNYPEQIEFENMKFSERHHVCDLWGSKTK